MSDTSIVPKVDHQQKTLSQEDLELLAASNTITEQEAVFIANLNVDAEEKKVFDTIEAQPITQEKKVIDLDDLKMYVMKAVSRQNLSPNLAAMEPDFYDKVELVADEITENAEGIIKQFISERLERIIMYSKSFSTNVCNMLTAEERELYMGLCECVSTFRKKMDQRLKIE
jgi:DNA replication initiation complex subunit (GINS family)